MVDTPDSKSSAERRGGSIPLQGKGSNHHLNKEKFNLIFVVSYIASYYK